MIYYKATGQIYTDQTDRFPTRSTAGNCDMLVMYDYDSNIIHIKLMSARTSYQIMLAYQRALRLLISCGLRPRLQKLDNECSDAPFRYLEDEHIEYQLNPLPSTVAMP